MAESIMVRHASRHIGVQVQLQGWVQRSRQAGGNKRPITFVDLRDASGTGQLLQCVLHGHPDLPRESSIRVCGIVVKMPEGKLSSLGVELQVNKYVVIHRSITGDPEHDLEALLAPEAAVPHVMDTRHMRLRTGTTQMTMILHARVLRAFREWLEAHNFMEVVPPLVVETLCEGGSDLFPVNYFDSQAYLTQSSQMFLEPVIAAGGAAYCIAPSFRAELSTGPRHLAQFTHLELEAPFIDFDGLLRIAEDLVMGVARQLLSDPDTGPMIQRLRAELGASELVLSNTSTISMTYKQAIQYCRVHKIYKDEETKTHFRYGDDIPASPPP